MEIGTVFNAGVKTVMRGLFAASTSLLFAGCSYTVPVVVISPNGHPDWVRNAETKGLTGRI